MFKSFDNWLEGNSKDSNNGGVTVLFPCGVKPIHGGHLDLIKRYNDNDLVKEIRILIGPGTRDGIDQELAFKTAQIFIQDLPKAVAEKVHWPSPVLTAYKIISEAPAGKYALAASSKGEDYKRVEDFVLKHSPGGKFYREEVQVVSLPINSSPLLFKGRTDEHEGEPISASVLRKDIMTEDFENFLTGYPNSSADQIAEVWELLEGRVVLNETIYTTGKSSSTTSSYDRSQPGHMYRSMFPIEEEEDKDTEDISEGGGAGHMMSPWEYTDMTFEEIKTLIEEGLTGRLKNVSEKLDGQNIMLTYRNGDVYIARTQKQLRNYGELSIKWDSIGDYIKYSEAKEAYQNACNDLHHAFKSISIDLDGIFNNGQKWLNIELLTPNTENIIPYGQNQLRIHHLVVVDRNGKTEEIVSDGELDRLISSIEIAQSEGGLGNTHLIAKTNRVKFNEIKELSSVKSIISQKIDGIMEKYHLDGENTIGDYIEQGVKSLIGEYFAKINIEDKQLEQELTNRWAKNDKSVNIKKITGLKDKRLQEWIRSTDDDIEYIISGILDPIIEIFSLMSITVLKNLSDIASTNPNESVEKIREKIEDAIEKIKSFIIKDRNKIKDFDKKVQYLETQLKRIETIGGLDSIAPIEGIVFEFNGKLFKLTGGYLPLLRIVNFFAFGKDKEV